MGKLGNIIAQGNFTPLEENTSSTYRELAAVKHLLNSFGNLLKHETVLWHSDNQNVSKILTAYQKKHGASS